MKKLFLFILTLILLFTGSGCSFIAQFGDNQASQGEENTPRVTQVSKVVMTDIYATHPEMSSDEPVASFTDGTYNYFYFKIGEVGRVPIAYSDTKYYEGIGTRTLSFETSQSVEKNIASTTEQCLSVAVSTKVGTTIESEVGIGNQTSFASASTSVLLETSVETTSSASTSQSLTKSISDIFSKCESDVFELKSDCPAGFYRYTVYANCEIYAAIKANIEEETFEYTYLSYVKGNSKITGWFYSKDGYFETQDSILDNIDQLKITDEMLESVDLFGELDNFVKIGARSFTFSSPSAIDTDYQYSVTLDFKEKFDVDLLKKMGYEKIRIKVEFALQSPKGDCQSKFKAANGKHELWVQDWVQVTPTKKNFSKTLTMNLSDLSTYGNKLTLAFICRSDGILDLAKNSYNVKDGVLSVSFE